MPGRDNGHGGDFSNPWFNEPASKPAGHHNIGHLLAQELRKNIKLKSDILSNPNAPQFSESIRTVNSEIDKLVSQISKNKQDLENPNHNRTGQSARQAEADMNAYKNALREFGEFSAKLPKETEATETPREARETAQPRKDPVAPPSTGIPSYESSLPSQAATENMRVKPDRTGQFIEPSNTQAAAPRVDPISASGVAKFVRDESEAAKQEAQRLLAEAAKRAAADEINIDRKRDYGAISDAARAEGNKSAALLGAHQGKEQRKALDDRYAAKYDPETEKLRKFIADDLAGIDPAVTPQAQPAPLTRENLESLEATHPSIRHRYNAESARSIPTMHTETLNNFANALGVQEHEKRMEMTNPYKAPEAKSNPIEVKAIRSQQNAQQQARQDNALNAITPNYQNYKIDDVPPGVDLESATRDNLLKILLAQLNHHDQSIPTHEMFAADDPNKVLGDAAILDYFKARHNLNDPRKLQEFLGNINGNNRNIGDTYRALLDEESILGKTKPYLDKANAPITSESLNEFSRPNVDRMNQEFRKQALERFKEEADERRHNFLGNLHSQYGGYNWFSSQRKAAEKQFNDAELRRERDLEDRLKREEHLNAQNERHLGANLMMDNRRRNLSSAEQVGKTASLSNITRAAAAQNLERFNESQEGKHIEGINRLRDLGMENTAREQGKLNTILAQKKTLEANNRNAPAALFGTLQGKPIPAPAYDQRTIHTPTPDEMMVRRGEFNNVRAPDAVVNSRPRGNNNQDFVQQNVDIARNVLGA